MRGWPGPLLAGAVAMAAMAAEPATPKPVTLDATTVRRLAIVTAPARAASQDSGANAFARVLDPVPLAQLDADIAAAAAAAAASAAEAARSRALFAADATVSRKVSEAAAMQARGDSARLTLLRRRLGLEWGAAFARLGDAERGALVAFLATGHAALVRIDSAGGAGQSGLRNATLDLGSLGSVAATILGPARAADPRLQSPGLIARVSGPKAALLSTGLSIPVRLGGVPRAGVSIPAAAVLRLDGATWAYIRTETGTFVRRRLGGTISGGDFLFAASGVRAGDPVVISGAAALYAAEHRGGPADD